MRAVLGVTLLVLAGCASTQPAADVTRSGQVGVRDVTAAAPADARLTLAGNETYQAPLPARDNALPAYPAALLPQALPPRAVCVQVGIGEDGRVIGTAPVAGSADCPELAADARLFFDAASAATTAWRFEPAFRCVFDRVPEPNESCGTDGTREVPQAVSLVYRFVFEQVDGRGTVRVGE